MVELIFYILILLSVLVILGYIVGKLIFNSFIEENQSENSKLNRIFEFIENLIFKLCGIKPETDMNGKQYFSALLITNIVFFITTFLLLYVQDDLPFGENAAIKLDLPLIFHTISSYISNTDQTHINTELHLTLFSNYFTLPLLMFFSGGTGIAVGVMFIRGITRSKLGNFYSDIVKSYVRVLIPLSLILSLIFVLTGVPNTFKLSVLYNTLENLNEKIILGPIAALEAIKILGENGGGIYNANSAHPYSNPNYFSNFVQIVSMLLIPTAIIFALGFSLKNIKQSLVIFLTLFSIFIFQAVVSTSFELSGNKDINILTGQNQPNWMGKETRFGIASSVLYSLIASSTSGATNSSLEQYNPISTAFMLFNLAIGPVFGNQGVGPIYGFNLFLYTAIFIGFMLGKTPEMFGRKIEKNEVILGSLILLLNPFVVLPGILLTLYMLPENSVSLYENIHYYTRVFYEFLSAAGNNGSGLEGLADNNTFMNIALGTTMAISWFGGIGLMTALASSLATKPMKVASETTFKTDTLLFGFLYLLMSITLTLLIYFPFLIVGPIIEVFIN